MALIHTFFCLLFALQLIGSKGRSTNSAKSFIFGGLQAAPGQFPYMAFIQYRKEGEPYPCTGSLVTQDKVLTVAQCYPVEDQKENKRSRTKRSSNKGIDGFVYAGVINIRDVDAENITDGNIQKRVMKDIVIHPNYYRRSKIGQYDVAVLTVTEPFTMTKTVQLITISADKLVGPTNCTILGYGVTGAETEYGILMYATNILAQPVSYGCPVTKEGNFYCTFQQPAMACLGESGSPLVCGDLVKGLSVYGSEHECGETLEEVYLDLSAEKAFLNGLVPYVESSASNRTISILMISTVSCFLCLRNSLQLNIL